MLDRAARCQGRSPVRRCHRSGHQRCQGLCTVGQQLVFLTTPDSARQDREDVLQAMNCAGLRLRSQHRL